MGWNERSDPDMRTANFKFSCDVYREGVYIISASLHMLCSDPANKTKHWFVLQRITVQVWAVPVLDKNKAQICCSERTSGTGYC